MSREQSPNSQAIACHFAAMLSQLFRDPSGARGHADASAAVSAEHGFSFWLAGSAVLGGWARAADSPDDGMARLRRGLDDWAATGSVTYRTWYLGLLGEVLTRAGLVKEARAVLAEALALVERTEERLYEAELCRLRGESFLRGGTAPDEGAAQSAREAFEQSLDVARGQGAKSLELRAAISLTRLGQRRDLLAEVFGSFTEGFNTPDLVEAAELLRALS
ncbi:MAG: hypothetical protein U0797_06580 [Gemmataceae bacterium]